MPILTNSRPIFRIKYKDANIREVRKGNELEWGLYEIEYVLGSNSIENNENIKEYVWGYPGYVEDDFILKLPEGDDEEYGGFSAPQAEVIFGSGNKYRTCSTGWFYEPECLTYIPAITRNFHEDLLLFCRWTQRQYRWSGTIKNERYTWIDSGGGGGSFVPKTDSSGLGYGESLNSYYWDVNNNPGATADGTYSGTNCLPNCTTYAYGRCLQLGIGPPVYAFIGADGWHSVANFEAIQYDYSSLEEGDIIEWQQGKHVAVYEGNGMVSASGWPSNSTSTNYGHHWGPDYDTLQKISDYWYIENRSDDHSFNYKTIADEGAWVNDTTPDYIIKTSTGLGSSGGEGYWGDAETQSLTLDENICGSGTWASGSGNQNYPRVPERYDQDDEDQNLINPNPGDHWRTNQRYDPLNTSTWERDITYTKNSQDGYDLVFSNWSKKYNATLYGEQYPGYDTAVSGPIDGWKMNWGD